LGHPFNVVEKKAFSMGVCEVFDFAALFLLDIIAELSLGGYQCSLLGIASGPEVKPGTHGRTIEAIRLAGASQNGT
jgi:hypothetical protein